MMAEGKMSLSRVAVMELYCESGVRVKVITMLRNLGPFAKPEHGVFSLPPHMEGVSQK